MKKVILVLVFILIATKAFCFDFDGSRETLKGLKTLAVRVAINNEVLPITEKNIRTDVELKLRREGITIVDFETLNHVDDALLYVEIYIVKSEYLLYGFSIKTEVYQNVTIPRLDNNDNYFASTWSMIFTGLAGENNTVFIRDTIKDIIDQFLNAYLSVNPK